MNSIIAFLLLGGTIMSVLAVIGILRLPDMYSRLHATTKSTTLGVIMIMAGAFLYFWYVEGLIETNLLLGALFILITAPVSSHLLSRSAFHADVKPYKLTVLNDLKRDETNPDAENDPARDLVE
ncbi:monovalent cation/H(+) antiporter subunit G [Lacicoccus qingdaonensis]|uniref:Multisubunit sodium/proton antiporter, MrpG subunit n=1 Tax=Lacicoccus qingdaonensis TaxID=576118 RepID=A0A1G9IFE1_9BACL|nr:monovalent cation/H(+) antiporter subunit G [Salinicoccus qingdaonensis]SDL23929.1 multisubunit sodium/proton antiporter, MrpG subunit [Salinicoccus qingdaonensis]